MSQLIYKNGCWGCKRAQEALEAGQEYTCPQVQQHWINYQKQLERNNF